MPTVFLNKIEVSALVALPLNSIKNQELSRAFYYLQLLIDEESGELEVPGGIWDQLRRFAFDYDNQEWKNLICSIFSRTLGDKLDLGFFEK